MFTTRSVESPMMDATLALGLLFTTASQLRLPGVPVGPGELCLIVWIAAVVLRIMVLGTRSSAHAVSALLAFWAALALALSIGMMVAVATAEEFDLGLVLHDVAAYALITVMSCLCAATPFGLRRVCWLLVISGAISLSLQFANGMGLIRVPGIDPWFWERFRGWSANPNQLSIICLILVLLAWYLGDATARSGARVAAMLLMVPPLVVGRMSQSDTFMFALTAALPIWIAVKLTVWMREDRSKSSLRSSLARLGLVAAPVLLLCLAPLVLTEAADVEAFMIGFAKKGGAEARDETNLRLALWQEAIERGVESGMLGLGPGPHLQIPPALVAERVSVDPQIGNIDHPTQNGTANYEAHNTLLDVFTQGGVLAVASLLWLLARAMRCAYRAQSAGLVSLLASVAIFMMTGNIIRQPIFWFAVVLCLTAPVSRFAQRIDGRLAKSKKNEVCPPKRGL
jgi:O-Antigen ligase